ncbi:MFS transporter [Pseudonocardia spinosispora]|uniref:MFS transporter n=1 Tax=Pseudonocardia spinosispora TaxID=103441 RepID=UPI0003FA42CA|nr:MFS transporter [Pseudonocardia spinosispora]
MELTTPPRQRILTLGLVAICLGYFLVILDSTIVNVALPTLRRDLGADLAALQWVVDGYLLTFAAGLLGGGALGDRIGGRRVFQLGLAVFVIASAACGLAPDAATLIAARTVQGVGAALAVPTSLALLRAAYPERTDRARAVGIWGGVAGLAAAAGPVLGGLLVDVPTLGWRLVFFVNVPLGLLAMVLTARRVPAPAGSPGTRIDLPGQCTGALALAALTYTLIEGDHGGITRATAVSASVFLAASTAFVLLQRFRAAPMLDLTLFRSATFTGGTAVGLLINLGFYGEMFVLNLHFQQTRHESPLVAGLALLPQMGVVAVGSALSGRFTGRAGGPRPTMIIGLLVGAGGLAGLACCVGLPYPMLVLPLVAAGFGMSFTMPAATSSVVDAAPANRAGAAAGVINTARQIGSVIGIAVLGALADGATSGPRTALFVSAAAFLLGAALAVLRSA